MEKIYRACFDALKTQKILNATDEAAFVAQASSHLCISYQITPIADGYQKTYQRNGWQLDAVRQTRDFQSSLSRPGEKDSLTGTHSAFAGRAAFQKEMEERLDPYSKLFKHSDQLGAITLIKRVAHFKSPLQDLIREAQKAEKDAKRDIDKGGRGRAAFSITLLKRSGEISKWAG